MKGTDNYPRGFLGGLVLALLLGSAVRVDQVNAQQGVLLTLKDAIQLALERNESYLSAREEMTKARAQIRQARSDALPTLTLNSFYTRSWRLPEVTFGGRSFRIGTDNVLNFGFNLVQPLYKGGKMGAARRTASLFTDFSEANLDNTRQNVLLQVHQAFYGVLLAEEMLRVSQSALKRAQVQLKQVEKFYQAGTVSEYDLLRAQVQVANTKPGMIRAQNALALAEASLKHLIGIKLGTPLTVKGDFQVDRIVLPNTLEEAIALARQRRPDIRAAETRTEMMDQAIIVERGNGRPNIALVTGYQMQAQLDDGQFGGIALNDFVKSLNTRLTFDFNLFDGWKNRARVSQAQVDYRQAEYQERLLKNSVVIEVIQAFLRLKEARERMVAEQEAVQLAERGLAIAQVRFENGMSTQLEVIDAQLTLTQAQTNHANALHDHAMAVVTMRKTLGIL